MVKHIENFTKPLYQLLESTYLFEINNFWTLLEKRAKIQNSEANCCNPQVWIYSIEEWTSVIESRVKFNLPWIKFSKRWIEVVKTSRVKFSKQVELHKSWRVNVKLPWIMFSKRWFERVSALLVPINRDTQNRGCCQ